MGQAVVTTSVLEVLYKFLKRYRLPTIYVPRCLVYSQTVGVGKHIEMNPDLAKKGDAYAESKTREDHYIAKAAEFYVYHRGKRSLPGLTIPSTKILSVDKKSFLPDMVCDRCGIHVKSWRKDGFHKSGLFPEGLLQSTPTDREIFSHEGSRSPAWVFLVEVELVREGGEDAFFCETLAIVQVRTLHQLLLFQDPIKLGYEHKRAVYLSSIREFLPDGLDPRVKADVEIELVTPK